MARLCFALACTQVLIDQRNNLVTYVNCMTGGNFAYSEGGSIPPLVLSSYWAREEEDDTFEARVQIREPGGKVRKQASEPIPVKMSKDYHRLNVTLVPIAPMQIGVYHLELYARRPAARWRKVASVPLHVLAELPGDIAPPA
jgi:hypothetical protein